MSRPLHIPVSPQGPDPDTLTAVVRHLEAGNLIAYPTETLYGFGGLARADAIARLQRMKPPEERVGFLVLIPDRKSVAGLRWTPEGERLATAFWPGPLTLVMSDPEQSLPEGVRSSSDTVAVRVSPHPVAGAVVAALGAPLMSTSANVPGERPAASADAAMEAAYRAGADRSFWVLDGGPAPGGRPSTVVDTSHSPPRLLRAGALPVDRIRTICPEIHEPE